MASLVSRPGIVRPALYQTRTIFIRQHGALLRQGQVRTAFVTNFPFWSPKPRIPIKVPILDPILYHGSPLPANSTSTAEAAESGLNQATATLSPPSSSRWSLKSPWLSNLADRIAAPFHAYARAQTRRPYVVQLVTTLVIYFLGDLSAQYFTRPRTHEHLTESDLNSDVQSPMIQTHEPSFIEYYEPKRAVRSLVIGGISAIPNFHWHVYLSHAFNVGNSRIASLAVKILVQQLVHTPILNSYFFFMQAFLGPLSHPEETGSEHTLTDAVKAKVHAGQQRVVSALPTSWINSFMFWPIVTAINFRFVPVDMRSVFGGAAAIGWNSYLLVLNQKSIDKGQ